MFSEAEMHQIENIIYNVLKNENILQRKTGQTVLEVNTDVSIEEDVEEYMKDKSVAIWLFSNDYGKSHNIKTNQLYIFPNGDVRKVLKVLPLTFEEAFNTWELHSAGASVTDIFTDKPFDYSPVISDISFIIWALENGKCDWMLKNTWDDRYFFDFKKYIQGKKQ